MCRGGVFAERDDLKIACDTFEGFRDEKKSDFRRIVCADNVVITSKDGKSKSDKAEWRADTQTLILSGNPVVTRDQDVLRGEIIVYDLKNDRFIVKNVRGKVAQQPALPKP